MLNPKRLLQLAVLTWQRSPRWYLFAHLGGCLMISIIMYFIFGDTGIHFDDGQVIYPPLSLFYGFTWVNIFALLAIAAHLVGRHFKNERNTIDYLSLPVTTQERYLILIIGLLLIIPAMGILSSILYFAGLKTLVPGIIFPAWKWMLPLIFTAIFGYYIGVLPFFALGFLRPNQTVIWAIGIVGICIGIAALLIRWVDSPNLTVDLLPFIGDSTPANLFGPSMGGQETAYVNPMGAFIVGKANLVMMAVAPSILFLISAYRALRNKEA